MASGHVNRIYYRPNTRLHRPTLQREESPCQLGGNVEAEGPWRTPTNVGGLRQ